QANGELAESECADAKRPHQEQDERDRQPVKGEIPRMTLRRRANRLPVPEHSEPNERADADVGGKRDEASDVAARTGKSERREEGGAARGAEHAGLEKTRGSRVRSSDEREDTPEAECGDHDQEVRHLAMDERGGERRAGCEVVTPTVPQVAPERREDD